MGPYTNFWLEGTPWIRTPDQLEMLCSVSKPPPPAPKWRVNYPCGLSNPSSRFARKIAGQSQRPQVLSSAVTDGWSHRNYNRNGFPSPLGPSWSCSCFFSQFGPWGWLQRPFQKTSFATPIPPKALPGLQWPVSVTSSDGNGKRGENNLSFLQQGGKPARAEAQ